MMLDYFVFYLALITLASTVVGVSLFLNGVGRLKVLRKLAFSEGEPQERLPFVSVVVAARNEERHIAAAIQSLLEIEYEPWELLVIDDRSTDKTPQILADLQRLDPRLRVQRIEMLPEGWLGKNHALDVGIRQSKGELVLLTDADIFFEKTALKRAVSYMTTQGLDHLAIAPDLNMPGPLLRSFTVMFYIFFFIFTQAWKASDPKSRASIGIGAFGLFRRQALMDVGGLTKIPLRPDDDLMLGRLIKRHGFRQSILDGAGMISVPWYSSTSELITGLEKNSFAALNYRPDLVLGSLVFQFLMIVWPFLALLFTHGYAWWLNLITVMLLVGMPSYLGIKLRYGWYSGLYFPVCTVLFGYIQLRAMLLCFWIGGIRWRDTFYPLQALKKNMLA
jgi:glycosyltransferase involved in cell wall biosynthesis